MQFQGGGRLNHAKLGVWEHKRCLHHDWREGVGFDQRRLGNLRLLKINKRKSFNQNTIENIHNNTYQDFLLDGV